MISDVASCIGWQESEKQSLTFRGGTNGVKAQVKGGVTSHWVMPPKIVADYKTTAGPRNRIV